MKIALDREKKVILLRWLQQGYIETLDLPEAYRESGLFYDLLVSSGTTDEDTPAEQQEQNTALIGTVETL